MVCDELWSYVAQVGHADHKIIQIAMSEPEFEKLRPEGFEVLAETGASGGVILAWILYQPAMISTR